VAPDLRGHGESEKPPGGYTVSAHADDLHALLGALGVERPTAVGGSMDSMVAYEYLKRRCSRTHHTRQADTFVPRSQSSLA
jgi:pimeloyl-ACP methyl ester carboxylesterase